MTITFISSPTLTMYDPETLQPFTIRTESASIFETQGGMKLFLERLQNAKAGKVYIYDLKAERCDNDIRHTFRYATRPLKENEKVVVYKEIEEEIYL